MKRKSDAELLAELVERLGGRVAAGVVRGQLAGDGMVATVEVRLERVVPAGEAEELLAQALALAEREPWRVCRCAAIMPKRSFYTPDCSKPVSMVRVRAIALDLRQSRPHHFQFYCSVHAKQARQDGAIATLVLPRRRLDELRALAERKREELRRADAEEDRALAELRAFAAEQQRQK